MHSSSEAALHIVLNDFRHASRVLKEASSLVASRTVSRVYVAALHETDLAVDQDYGENIHAHRFALKTRGLNKSFPAQFIKYTEYCFRVTRFYRARDVGIVNVHALGLLPLGVYLKWRYKARLVYDTHELETERNGVHGFRKKVSQWLERLLIKHADMTLVVSENIADWYAQTYNMSRPPVVLNAPWYKRPGTSDVFRETFGIRADQTIFLYQGGLMNGRGVPLLLEAFRNRSDDRAVIVFMGYGVLADEVKAAAHDTPTMFYQPAVAPDVVLDYTCAADVGMHMIANTCLNHYYCMPNKLFEYTMAGLPVIISDMKEMREFVERYDCGFVVKEADVVAINQAIDKVLETDLTPMKDNALKAAADNCWEEQERKMLAAYDALLSGQ